MAHRIRSELAADEMLAAVICTPRRPDTTITNTCTVTTAATTHHPAPTSGKTSQIDTTKRPTSVGEASGPHGGKGAAAGMLRDGGLGFCALWAVVLVGCVWLPVVTPESSWIDRRSCTSRVRYRDPGIEMPGGGPGTRSLGLGLVSVVPVVDSHPRSSCRPWGSEPSLPV